MSNNIQQQTLGSFPELLKPIIRILLRSGVDFKQFVNLSREIYVDVASEDYGINGRPTNTSRIALLTGIGRTNVAKIRKELGSKQSESKILQTNQASKVLHAWHNDKLFLNDAGLPKLLNIVSESKPSLSDLIKKYRGDIPAKVLFKELLSSRSVEVIDDMYVRAISKTFIPKEQVVKDIFKTETTLNTLKNIIHLHSLIDKQVADTRYEKKLIYYDAAHVLSMWNIDDKFLDSNEKPLPLKIHDGNPNFAQLVEKYAGESEPKIILQKLVEAESVRVTKKGVIHSLNRRVILPNSHIAYKARLSSVLTDIVNTLQYNLVRAKSENSRFEGRATNRFFPKELLLKFDTYLKKRGQDFLNEIDEWLDKETKEFNATRKNHEKMTLGVGLYMINRSKENGQK